MIIFGLLFTATNNWSKTIDVNNTVLVNMGKLFIPTVEKTGVLSLFLIVTLMSSESKLIGIFKDNDANIEKYIVLFTSKLFPNTGVRVVTNKNLSQTNFSVFDGFVYPGGGGNITDRDSDYWSYVNKSMATFKPVFGICLGFQHVVKHYFPTLKQTRCYLYNMVIDGQQHNHKWCIPKNRENTLGELFDLGFYSYNGTSYIGTIKIEETGVFGTIFHPEKQTVLTSIERKMLRAFYRSMS